MSEIRMVKGLGEWRPATEEDYQLTQAWKVGDVVKFKASKPRNGQHHRLFFALIGLVFDNLPEQYVEMFPSRRHLIDELKFQVGHFEEHRTLGGKVGYVPRSIAYDSMDQAEFNTFYDDCVKVICKYFLPGLSEESVKQEVLTMIAGGRW